VHVAVDVGLLVRPAAAVALGIGHRDAERQVLVLHAVQVLQEARRLFARAAGVVDARGHLPDRVERVVGEVALGAAGFLAHDAHGLELVQQVAGAGVDVGEAVHAPAARVLHCRHERRQLAAVREVVGERDGIDAGLQRARIRHALDGLPVDEHARAIAPQRLAVIGARHQGRAGSRCVQGRLLGMERPFSRAGAAPP
jgi:hypothetical protein